MRRQRPGITENMTERRDSSREKTSISGKTCPYETEGWYPILRQPQCFFLIVIGEEMSTTS